MTHAMKPLSCDPNRVRGMSERMIISHYKNNYGGAVKRLNLIDEKIAESGMDMAPAGDTRGKPKMRNLALTLLVLASLLAADRSAQAQTCKVCAEQRAACMKNYAGPACKTEYQMCLKSCKK